MDEQREQLEALAELGSRIEDILGADLISQAVSAVGELEITVKREAVARAMTQLRDDSSCGFNQLIDLCGVDYPERVERFDVVYHLLSLRQNQRLRVRVATDADHPVPSVAGVFSAAGWFEREAWDLYGITFSEHPDLRRILTDYGFEGHPMRKDFPLTGYVEVRYDDERKAVVYEPVKLTQEFRSFDFLSPWEGAEVARQALLPGDEKADEGTDGTAGGKS